MHTGALKKLALALTFWLALHTAALKAQIFTNDLPLQAITTGTNPVDFEFRADGTLIGKGNLGVGSLLTGDQGDGTRMLWFASLAAFRAGGANTGLSVGSGPWDSSNIGQYSAAFGLNTTASGAYSFAVGNGAVAYDSATIAMGQGAKAWTQGSTAMGAYTGALGYASTALGAGSAAWGDVSTATGSGTTSNGQNSISMGRCTNAAGDNSSASGYYTIASSYDSFVLGCYNIGSSSSGTTWVATDPLFEIGNGTATTPSDALIVYKNGNVAAQGVITAAPGGDIPMYTGE